MSLQDKFNAKTTFDTGSGEAVMYRLDALQEQGIADISRLPYSIKVLLEAALRQCDGFEVTEARRDRPGQLATATRRTQGDAVQTGPRGHAGLHRRARGGGPGGAARPDGAHGRRPGQGQPADSG